MEALGGNLANGLTTEVWWHRNHPYKSSLTGETAKQLCDAWTKETKKQWIPPIGLTYGGYELAFDVIKRAETLNKDKIREALRTYLKLLHDLPVGQRPANCLDSFLRAQFSACGCPRHADCLVCIIAHPVAKVKGV